MYVLRCLRHCIDNLAKLEQCDPYLRLDEIHFLYFKCQLKTVFAQRVGVNKNYNHYYISTTHDMAWYNKQPLAPWLHSKLQQTHRLPKTQPISRICLMQTITCNVSIETYPYTYEIILNAQCLCKDINKRKLVTIIWKWVALYYTHLTLTPRASYKHFHCVCTLPKTTPNEMLGVDAVSMALTSFGVLLLSVYYSEHNR